MKNQDQAIVDLKNLRELIGEDPQLEQDIISLFLSSSIENINYLKNNAKDNEDGEWKINSHSLKGASKNIGAMHLGDLCSKAQEAYCDSASEKQKIYLEIEEEFEKVKTFLLNRNNEVN